MVYVQILIMDNEQSNHHNDTNDCIRKCISDASNESSNELVNSKERKEIHNTQILCRTLSGISCASSPNKPTSDNKSTDTIIEEGHSSENTSKAQRGNNLFAANSSCSDGFETNISSSRPNNDPVQGTAVLDFLASGIEQVSVRTKDNNRESSRKDFASRQAELQSMEVDEEKMPDMMGSYSEILGKPLFMSVAEEQTASVSILPLTPKHIMSGNNTATNHCESNNPESSMPATKSVETCSYKKKHSGQSTVPKLVGTSPNTHNPHNVVKSNSSYNTSSDTGLDTTKVPKPTSLPHLHSHLEKYTLANGSAGAYYKYYSATDPEELEEEPDVETPVYEDMDPAQAILSHHRLAAYLASPDCPPDCLTPGAASLSMPSTDVMDSADATGTVANKLLAVGRCGPELAEAALQSAGTVTRLPNNTVAFVADDLHQKIKLASPSSAGSGASTPMFGYHSHPYLGPHMLEATPPYSSATTPQSLATPPYPYGGRHHPLDHTLLNDIEKHARRLATNVDGLIESLTDSLHGISALTVDCVETYRDTVCKTCDAVDANIKSMYQLMAKAEELSKAMKPVYGLHVQIKDVRRTLDLLEAEMHSSGS